MAGDPEREHVAEVEKDGGIWYHRNVISAMASELGCCRAYMHAHAHTHTHTHTQIFDTNKCTHIQHVYPNTHKQNTLAKELKVEEILELQKQ